MKRKKKFNLRLTADSKGGYDFVITSKDYMGMEKAYDSLPGNLKRKMTGSGFCFISSERDHHFVIGSRASNKAEQAKSIVKHYMKVIGKTTKIDILDNNLSYEISE